MRVGPSVRGGGSGLEVDPRLPGGGSGVGGGIHGFRVAVQGLEVGSTASGWRFRGRTWDPRLPAGGSGHDGRVDDFGVALGGGPDGDRGERDDLLGLAGPVLLTATRRRVSARPGATQPYSAWTISTSPCPRTRRTECARSMSRRLRWAYGRWRTHSTRNSTLCSGPAAAGAGMRSARRAWSRKLFTARATVSTASGSMSSRVSPSATSRPPVEDAMATNQSRTTW